MTYDERVQAYEAEGMTRSDAQGIVDLEDMRAIQDEKPPICWISLCCNPAYHRRMTYVPNGPGFRDVEKVAVMLCGDCARQFDNKMPDTDKFY